MRLLVAEGGTDWDELAWAEGGDGVAALAQQWDRLTG